MKVLHSITALSLGFALYMIFFFAPIEQTQGIVQKIFYIHVASAITMYIGFFIAFVASIFYLLEKKPVWDQFSIAGAEVSFFLCTLVLITGPIWARPVWGVWWTWEPRLTTTSLLWLLYAGAMVLRGYFEMDPRGKVITSVLFIVDFLSVPLVHFSVRLWQGVHPTVLGPEGGGISPDMRTTLLVTFVAIFLLFCSLYALRFQLEKKRNLWQAKKLEGRGVA